MYGHDGHHILHEEEKNVKINTALIYDPKEYKFLLYCPFYLKYLEDYTKTMWHKRLCNKAVTEDKEWGLLFYLSNLDKSKQFRRLKASEARIFSMNFDT